jgi:hypothetical protein
MPVDFSYELTGSGWARAELRVDNELVRVTASDMSPRTPVDFLDALLVHFYGARVSWASWMEEPEYIRWQFTRGPDRDRWLHVALIDADDPDPWLVKHSRLRFQAKVDLTEFATSVAKSFERLLGRYGDRGYSSEWRNNASLADLRERATDLRAVLTNGPQPSVPARLYVHPHPMDGGWASDLFRRRPISS